MLQDQFLTAAAGGRVPVTIYLVNGIRLQGVIDSFDRYGVILGGDSQQFVYKHAISTIVPMRHLTPEAPPEPAAQARPPAQPKTAAPPEPAPPPETAVRPETEDTTAAPKPKKITTLRPRRPRPS